MEAHEKIVCVYEDRPDHLVGVRLLALSLLEFEPSWRIVFFSVALPDDEELSVLSKLDNVVIRHDVPKRFSAWNVKPALLLKLLEEGIGEVMWIDSDILLTAPLSSILNRCPKDALVITEEYPWGMRHGSFGSVLRTKLWGFPVGRELGYTVNFVPDSSESQPQGTPTRMDRSARLAAVSRRPRC